MKALKLIIVMIFALGLTTKAQTGLETGTRWGHGEDSVKSVMSYSLFSEYAKQKNYADALEPWMYCFENSPSAGKGIYIYGVKIVQWEIKNAATKEEKNEKIEKLMQVYDQRIKYFGDDKRYPEAYILGLKAIDYKVLKRNDIVAEKKAYGWLKESIDGLGASVTPKILNHYMALSFSFFSTDEISGEELLSDYEMIQEKLNKIVSRGGKNADVASKMIESFEQTFANSGAADCTTLENLYTAQYEKTPNDKELLTKLLNLFEKTECTESQLYYKASESMHKIEPSASSAAGVAKMYLAQDNIDKAVQYFEEAISLETNDKNKSQYQYTLAFIAFSKYENMSKARQYALEAIQSNTSWGDPHLLIGKMYAQSAQEQKLGSKETENKAGYWAAVDQFNKAKRVDPSCEEEANHLIKVYSNYFPSKEEIFFDPDIEEGKTTKVGGWIGISTIVRARD